MPKAVRANTIINTEIDTHQNSIHGSMDISAVNLYKRFKERYREIVPTSNIEEKGKIEITRTEAFENLINEKLYPLI